MIPLFYGHLCPMKKNNFISGAINHCYQRTSDHGVLFYDTCDRLMFFTIFCIVAARQNVQVLKLVLMPDHTHHSTITSTKQKLAAFNRDYESIFAHEYNARFGRNGPLFEKPFGRAQKCGDKYIRGHLLYLDNNPVERKLVKKAEEYRWNFLAYGISAHPFSKNNNPSRSIYAAQTRFGNRREHSLPGPIYALPVTPESF